MIIFGLNTWEQASDLLLERDGGKKHRVGEIERIRKSGMSWREEKNLRMERRKEFENILYAYCVYLKSTHSV